MSHERDLTDLEIAERNYLVQEDIEIEYSQSLPAFVLSRDYVRAFGKILDFSSIVQKHGWIYKSLFEPSETVKAQVEILAKYQRNVEFRFKDESEGLRISSVIAGSTKQHLICHHLDDKHPYSRNTGGIVTRRIKGISRSRHKEVQKVHFIDYCIRNVEPMSVCNFRISRDHFRLFVTKTRKKCLSRFTVKRLIYNRHNRELIRGTKILIL